MRQLQYYNCKIEEQRKERALIVPFLNFPWLLSVCPECLIIRIVVAVLGRRWQSACRIHYADNVCKPPKGAMFKRYGTERLGKRCRKASGKCNEAECE